MFLCSDHEGVSHAKLAPMTPLLPLQATSPVLSMKLLGQQLLHSIMWKTTICHVLSACHTETKNIALVIPAQHFCPAGWNNEFSGYLLTEFGHTDRQRRDTICVDMNAEVIPGTGSITIPTFSYLLRASCGTLRLPCPLYNDQMVLLPCAVCTK